MTREKKNLSKEIKQKMAIIFYHHSQIIHQVEKVLNATPLFYLFIKHHNVIIHILSRVPYKPLFNKTASNWSFPMYICISLVDASKKLSILSDTVNFVPLMKYQARRWTRSETRSH